VKYLNRYKIFENKNNTDSICRLYGIDSYSIGTDGLINVDNNVVLPHHGLGEISLNFGVVTGLFNCGYNLITSLEGCPSEVGGDFLCYCNELTSLSGGPKKVGGNYSCSTNKLTDLKGAPDRVDNFYCSSNKLMSLEGAPSSFDGIYCEKNPIYSVVEVFIYNRSAVELFIDTDIIRGDEIIYDRLIWFFEEIRMVPDMDDIKKHYKIIR